MGCTNEYFTLIMVNNDKQTSVKFHGMYGAEERVKHYLTERGYKYFYTNGEYGRLNSREIHKPTNYSEYSLINGGKLAEQIKVLRKRG